MAYSITRARGRRETTNERRLIAGDRLMRIDGAQACDLREADVMDLLRDSSYPRVYEFVRTKQRKPRAEEADKTVALLRQEATQGASARAKIGNETAAKLKKRDSEGSRLDVASETTKRQRPSTDTPAPAAPP